MATKIIQCFTIKRPLNNNIPLKNILLEFGKDIPLPCPYDGSLDGMVYLCCSENNIDVESICNKYKYIIGTIYKTEIDESQFNNKFMIAPTYTRDPPHYKLIKPYVYYNYDD
jgi:hypothetical protein